jgi:hypothetical protein
LIAELIDKQDNYEIIRDNIAAILASEIASQRTLAVNAGKDQRLWDLDIYIERSNPLEKWLNSQNEAFQVPIVNIWLDNSNVDKSSSNIVHSQTMDTVFNIDVYGLGISKDSGLGHIAGDKEAALEVQRGIRLVRNILMSSLYAYLGLRGVVERRVVQTITAFQPEQGGLQMQQVQAARLMLEVRHIEQAPQYIGQPLEYLSLDIFRKEDASIYVEADFDYTT